MAPFVSVSSESEQAYEETRKGIFISLVEKWHLSILHVSYWLELSHLAPLHFWEGWKFVYLCDQNKEEIRLMNVYRMLSQPEN